MEPYYRNRQLRYAGCLIHTVGYLIAVSASIATVCGFNYLYDEVESLKNTCHKFSLYIESIFDSNKKDTRIKQEMLEHMIKEEEKTQKILNQYNYYDYRQIKD